MAFLLLFQKGLVSKTTVFGRFHTVEENVIQVAYSRPYDFTLGHFLYYWLGNDLLQYDTKVYVVMTLFTLRAIFVTLY